MEPMVLPRGALVEVFYRAWADSDGDQGHEWHADKVAAGSADVACTPVRLTAGWVAASVLEDCRTSEGAGHVIIRYADRRWFNSYSEQLDVSNPGSLETAVPSAFVRLPARTSPRPRLSLLAVRWGGTPETAVDTTTFNWGSTNSSVSCTYSNTLFKAVERKLGCDFEIFSVFVSCTTDLQRLAVVAPAIARGVLQRGCARAAMYFLWPAAYGEATDADGSLQLGGGFVEASALLELMRTMETVDIPSRFPHPAALYETLASKSWQSLFCANDSLHIPSTVAVPADVIRGDADHAAMMALEHLALLRMKNSADTAPLAIEQTSKKAPWSVSPQHVARTSKRWADVAPGNDELGNSTEHQHAPRMVDTDVVVKLGFSWEAVDVTKVHVELQSSAEISESIARLGKALQAAISVPGCRNDSVLVQRFVRACCELRLFVVDGEVVGRYLARYDDTTESGKFQNWQQLGRAEAVAQWFSGDAAALASAEADAEALVPRLLAALHTVCAEPVPAIRLDFLLEQLPSGAGKGRASTLEITEAGFSMCFWEEGPALVFDAIVRSCLHGAEAAPSVDKQSPTTRLPKRQREGSSPSIDSRKGTAGTA